MCFACLAGAEDGSGDLSITELVTGYKDREDFSEACSALEL